MIGCYRRDILYALNVLLHDYLWDHSFFDNEKFSEISCMLQVIGGYIQNCHQSPCSEHFSTI